MIIRRLQSEDYPRVRQIWRECFGDTDAFLDEYFTVAASVSNGYGLFDNGILVSDLFILNFCAKVAGMQFKTDFLAGCATVEGARRKNYMRELIRRTLTDMADSGMPYSFLHPFLHEFYRKFGYETIAYVKRFVNTRNDSKSGVNTVTKIEEAPIFDLLTAYNNNMELYDNCFIRDAARFTAWLKLLFADGGFLKYTSGADHISYALYYDNTTGTREIFELILNNNSDLTLLTACDGVSETCYFLPSADNFETAGNERFTMMRVLLPAEALRECPLSIKDSFVIHIDDSFLKREYNLAVWPGETHNNIKNTDAKYDVYVDINLLAQLITGTYPTETSPIIQGIFPRRKSCFFETY